MANSRNYRSNIQEAEITFSPVGSHSQYTAGGVDSATTPTVASGATKLLIQCFTQNCRYTLDGTVPTTSKGFRLTAAADPVVIPINTGTTFKIISETAGAAVEYQWGN